MTPDVYVLRIIATYRSATGPGSSPYRALKILSPLIVSWAKPYLHGVRYSGAFAKGTAIRGMTDVDLFISLKSSTPGTLRDIYTSLFEFLTLRGLSPSMQNVSIGVSVDGISVDLVPGRRQFGNTTDHSLYHGRSGTWIQTNIEQHILIVRRARRFNEVRAMKIWQYLRGLDFPSFYLELATIEALRSRPVGRNLAANFMEALRFFAYELPSTRIVDPANSSNIISDDLSDTEKRAVAAQAETSLSLSWASVIW